MASINQFGPPAAGSTGKGKKRPRRESASARTEPFTGKKRKFKPDVPKSNVRTEKEKSDSAAGRGSAPGASGPASQRGQDPAPVIVDDLAYTEYCLIHHDVGHPTRSCVHVKAKAKAKSRAFELGWKELLDAKGIPVDFPLGHVPVTMFDVMRHVQKLNDFLGEAEGRIQARDEFFFKCRSGLQECMPTWLH